LGVDERAAKAGQAAAVPRALAAVAGALAVDPIRRRLASATAKVHATKRRANASGSGPAKRPPSLSWKGMTPGRSKGVWDGHVRLERAGTSASADPSAPRITTQAATIGLLHLGRAHRARPFVAGRCDGLRCRTGPPRDAGAFANAVADIMNLPLTPAENAAAVRRLLSDE
jgi:hypothetical protein